MTLHTVGPTDMAEDERRIGRGYQTWLGPVLAAAPLLVASQAETKWVVAVGFSAGLFLLHEAGGRLHDLCIRARRTNILLNQQTSENARVQGR
jgi:hypothetical protein